MASHYRLGVAVVVGFLLGMVRMAPAASTMRVAVMEFQRGGSADAQLDSLGKGLQSMVTTDLAQVSSMELVERSRMHDIEAEQKLARSGMVDPKTAVKIGKLAGATHLVTGTYIIVGGKMRLDARLFGVGDGKVLLAEQIEGDKDAFFELEKQLVNKVIGVIGVKLPPKERAEVARVHTADFEAFRKFSDGIGAFDDRKYEEAMAALKEAGTRDASFKLASITLAEYERVITELRTKADAIDSANAQLKRLEEDKTIQEEAAMVKKLYAISTTRAGADAQIQRLAALHILALIYGGDSQGHHEKLRKVQDEFAMQRTADTLWKSYFVESIQAFPKVPLNVTVNLESSLPKPATFDKNFAAFVDAMLHYTAGGFNHEESLVASGLRVKELAGRMHLDRGEEAALWGKATALAAPLHPSASFKQSLHEAYAKALRAAGDYGKSSTAFARLAAEEKDPGQLKSLADQIEENKEREQLLKNAKQAKLAREIMLTNRNSWSDTELKDMRASALGRTRPRARDLFILNGGRGMSRTNSNDDSGYVIVDGSPAWMVRGYESLGTGPRSDAVRASELRYYHPRPTAGALAIIDGVPREELSVHFQIDYTPGADWWPNDVTPTIGTTDDADVGKLKLASGRPEVALAFAVRDVDAADRPLHCLQLVIAADAVRLVEVTQKDPSEAGTIKVLGDKPATLRSERQLDVEIRVGSRVSATVNGKTFEFAAPAKRSGFYGVQFRGAGYASVKGWKRAGN